MYKSALSIHLKLSVNSVIHGTMGCGQKKKLSVSVAVSPAPLRVPSQWPLAPSIASVMSVANDKDDNEMILGTVNRSPGICLSAEESPRKPQLGDHLMRTVIASNGVPFLQMRSVGSHSTSGNGKEGRKEGRDEFGYQLSVKAPMARFKLLSLCLPLWLLPLSYSKRCKSKKM